MDAGKIHNLIRALEVARIGGHHVDIETRKTVDEVRKAPFLDRVDASVYVQYPDQISPVWEQYEGVAGYDISPTGALSVMVGGNDADGDWGSVRVIVYPDGAWLKFETALEPIPNPYFEADQAAESEAENAGE